jgi:hypothetical protein
MLPSFLLVLLFLFSVIVTWLAYSRRTTRFVSDFARLLESPRFGSGIARRSTVRGEFRGREVAILLQDGNDEQPSTLLITMATDAAPRMDTYDFAGYQGDRDGEVAAFGLEVKHGLTLRHVEGYLKASRDSFPSSFNPSKWQTVLEAMDTLCNVIEGREVPPKSGLSHGASDAQ